MATTSAQRGHLRRMTASESKGYTKRGGIERKRTWNPGVSPKKSADACSLEPYTGEDRLLDALGQLPDPEMVRKLVELLRPKELREMAEGVLNDCTQATLTQDVLENANAINSWVATAEETIASRRKFRFIQAARDQGKPPNTETR